MSRAASGRSPETNVGAGWGAARTNPRSARVRPRGERRGWEEADVQLRSPLVTPSCRRPRSLPPA
eukprot:6118123-Pyramimonas_sp.AAC.1